MNLSLKIARRYLFAKKSTNAINVISGIAVLGIAIGTTALILILSVFNGFEDLITGMYNNFNPDMKVTPDRGKTFEISADTLRKIQGLNSVKYVSQTLEEVALFDYKDNQYLGVIKGVDSVYVEVSNIDSTIREGRYRFEDGIRPLGVLGLGMRNKLGVNIDDLFTPVSIYMPKKKKSLFGEPFYRLSLYPGGTFNIQQEFDSKYVLTSLEFARKLLRTKNEVSALEIKLEQGVSFEEAKASIETVLDNGFTIRNRDEQEASFFRLMKMEKWLSFAIVGLMMVLIAFNLIGALWMIVLDKKEDIAILKSMGARDRTVQNIFLNEGILLCLLGLSIGFVLAILIYGIQKTVGIVSIPGNLIIEAYPISMRFSDFIVVTLTVLGIGLLASFPPALRTRSIPPIILEE